MLPSIRPLLHLHILLSLLFSHPAQSSIGVVEIDDLLQPDLQKPLKSPNHPDPSTQYAPWTHEPLCTVSTSFKSLGTKFCLYTNDRAFINGVSILTTPAAAEAAAEYLNEEPLSYFLSEAQQEEWFNGGEEGGNGRPWKIVPVEGKDLGVVATRRIRRHETFMVDQASVVMDLRMEKLVPRRESLRLLKKGVERLRRPGWVRELSGRHEGVDGGKDGEEEGDGEWEEHVMMTNAFGTQLGETEFRGLFPLVSVSAKEVFLGMWGLTL